MEWLQGWIGWFGYILQASMELPALPGWAWVIFIMWAWTTTFRVHNKRHWHDHDGSVIDGKRRRA